MSRKAKKPTDRLRALKRYSVQLVQQFSERALAGYQEPTKVGVPKGEPVGFPKKKMLAAYLCMLFPRALSLGEIAKNVDTTVGTLRVWRTQKEFQEQIETASRQFALGVLNVLQKLSATMDLEAVGPREILLTNNARVALMRRDTWEAGVEDLLPLGTVPVIVSEDIDSYPGITTGEQAENASVQLCMALAFTNDVVMKNVAASAGRLAQEGLPSFWMMSRALELGSRVFTYTDAEGNPIFGEEPAKVFREFRKKLLEQHIELVTDPAKMTDLSPELLLDLRKEMKALLSAI